MANHSNLKWNHSILDISYELIVLYIQMFLSVGHAEISLMVMVNFWYLKILDTDKALKIWATKFQNISIVNTKYIFIDKLGINGHEAGTIIAGCVVCLYANLDTKL